MSITIPSGTYRVLRVDGTEETIPRKPTIQDIERTIGSTWLDTVDLRRNNVVMLVDDNGHADGKPINPKATELYHAVCKPGTTWPIVGDVALVNDEDF
jgi:hypothetical protein